MFDIFILHGCFSMIKYQNPKNRPARWRTSWAELHTEHPYGNFLLTYAAFSLLLAVPEIPRVGTPVRCLLIWPLTWLKVICYPPIWGPPHLTFIKKYYIILKKTFFKIPLTFIKKYGIILKKTIFKTPQLFSPRSVFA